MRGHNRGRVKSRFWFSVWSWLSVLHMPAANLCVCDLERLPQDIHNLCQLNTERDRERESGHSADLSTSPEEISSTQGAFTLPKALTSNYLFFFFVQHSMQSSKKASAGVVCLMSLNAALLCCFPPLHSTHPSFLFILPHPLFWLCLWPFSYSFPPWEDLVQFPSN